MVLKDRILELTINGESEGFRARCMGKSVKKTQLSQACRATLWVFGDFAKSLKITKGYSKLHRWIWRM